MGIAGHRQVYWSPLGSRVFSWKRAEAEEGTELCKDASDFYSVMAYVISTHIPLATASLIAKIKGKTHTHTEKPSSLEEVHFFSYCLQESRAKAVREQ